MELDSKIISRDINKMLWRSGKTLSSAESCSAGRIASIITSIPGSSNYFKGGLVCYADEVKVEVLKVSQSIVDEKSAVCEDAVKQMVIGANDLFHSDYAVAISGFAGPGGGTDTIKIGTIWIAVGNAKNIKTCVLTENNGRDKNISAATSKAIHMLHDLLKEQDSELER